MGGFELFGVGLFEGIILYTCCLIGTIFWLRASKTDVSKGFAIFFMVYSAALLLTYISVGIALFVGLSRLGEALKQ